MATGAWTPAAAVAVLLAALSGPACKRRHVPVDSPPELGYPACTVADAGLADDPGISVGSGRIRAGPNSNEKNVVERFELRRTACGFTFRARQEWPLAISDIEVRYDADLRPIWAWKRMTIDGSTRA